MIEGNRYLIFYTFADEAPTVEMSEPASPVQATGNEEGAEELMP